MQHNLNLLCDLIIVSVCRPRIDVMRLENDTASNFRFVSLEREYERVACGLGSGWTNRVSVKKILQQRQTIRKRQTTLGCAQFWMAPVEELLILPLALDPKSDCQVQELQCEWRTCHVGRLLLTGLMSDESDDATVAFHIMSCEVVFRKLGSTHPSLHFAWRVLC